MILCPQEVGNFVGKLDQLQPEVIISNILYCVKHFYYKVWLSSVQSLGLAFARTNIHSKSLNFKEKVIFFLVERVESWVMLASCDHPGTETCRTHHLFHIQIHNFGITMTRMKHKHLDQIVWNVVQTSYLPCARTIQTPFCCWDLQKPV